MTLITVHLERPKLGTIPEISTSQQSLATTPSNSQTKLTRPTSLSKKKKQKKWTFTRNAKKHEGPDGPRLSSFLNGHQGQDELYPSKSGIYISPGLNRAYTKPAVEILMGVLIFIAGLIVLCVGFAIWGQAHDIYVIYTGVASCVAGLLFVLLGYCIKMSREKPPPKKNKKHKKRSKRGQEDDERSIVSNEVTQETDTP